MDASICDVCKYIQFSQLFASEQPLKAVCNIMYASMCIIYIMLSFSELSNNDIRELKYGVFKDQHQLERL